MGTTKWKLALSHCGFLLLGLGLGSQIPSLVLSYELSRDLALYEKQLRDEPASPENWVSLGITRSRANDERGAIRAYEKALELDPVNVSAHISMGTIHYQRDDFAEAEKWFDKALQAAHSQNDVSGIATADQLLKFARAEKARSPKPR